MNAKIMVAAAVLFGAGMAAVPAYADIPGCGANNVCLYSGNDYQGKIATRAAGQGAITNLGGASNRMNSWANNSNSYSACGWDGANGTGANQGWGPNSHDNNVAPWHSNEISSWRTKYGC